MTRAEAAWYRYSAAMPDSWLHCHTTFILLVIYTIAPLPLLALEHLAPSVVLPYKLQPRVRPPSGATWTRPVSFPSPLAFSSSPILRSPSYHFPFSPSRLIPFYGGAAYHDYHHYAGGRSQSNFAPLFTYCDYIYRTDKGYRYHKLKQEKLKNLAEDSAEKGATTHSTKEERTEIFLCLSIRRLFYYSFSSQGRFANK